MDYQDLSREQLLNRIMELEMLNKQLLEEKEQEVGLDYPWTGNLGHWYWNIKTNTVTFNSLKVTTLGYTKDEIPTQVNYQFFTDKLHPEDYENTMNAMLLHLQGKKRVYEVEYRIRTKNGGWKWFYDRGKITQFSEDGKPIFMSGIVFDITDKKELQLELENKNEFLKEQSLTDSLTKLKNYRALMDKLNMETDKAKHLKTPLSVALLDIDNFKQINDTKGHLFGDKILMEVAGIMLKSVREKDIVGRYGGEEFLIIFPNTKEESARSIADRIRQNIDNYKFHEDFKLTISGGVKEFKGESISEFIHEADLNLYSAKNTGKNKIK